MLHALPVVAATILRLGHFQRAISHFTGIIQPEKCVERAAVPGKGTLKFAEFSQQ